MGFVTSKEDMKKIPIINILVSKIAVIPLFVTLKMTLKLTLKNICISHITVSCEFYSSRETNTSFVFKNGQWKGYS